MFFPGPAVALDVLVDLTRVLAAASATTRSVFVTLQ